MATTTWASERMTLRGLLCRDRGRVRRSRDGGLAALVALVVAAPLGAQDYDAAALLETLDAQVMIPVSAGLAEADRADPDGRLPGFRLSATGRLGREWTTHAGVMRLAPTGASLFGGVVGAGRLFAFGPLEVELGAEAVAGRVNGLYVAGEWREPNGTPHAVLRESSGTSFGAGLVGSLDWHMTRRFGLRASAGYWAMSGGDAAPAAGGLYVGGGVSWLAGARFGGDAAAPAPRPASGIVIRILEPAESDGERGIAVAAAGSRRIIGVVRDLNGAGIEAVRVNGQLASLTSPDEQGVRFVGFVPGHEGVVPVEITAETVDGRIDYRVLRVQLTDDAQAEDRDGPVPQRFAVVIGVSEYADPLVPDLQYADDDARAFHAFLRSERAGLGGVPEENIVLLVNEDASYRNVRSALFSFLRRATENDVVYVYVAAHGVPDPNRPDELYLLPVDAEASDLPGTALPMADVNDAIARLRTRHTVVLTDACHSGGLGTVGFNARGLEPNNVNEVFLRGLRTTIGGLAVFTASEARQISREGRQWGGGHGVFTHYLLEGLRGAADGDEDRIVRLGEVMEYVRERVRRDTENAQIPGIGSFAHDRELPLAIVPES